ncbi:cytochrome P450 [Streptomyces sp. BI20]|uniref:cytochrome P450 n=1 Tax=Streptomyces sp. BI20 TaxID=3403460 RepID=UPI003C70B3A8
MSESAYPAPVPGASAENPYGLLTPEFFRDPYPAYARLRAEEPVRYFAPLDAWLLARYEDVDALLRSKDVSSDRVSALFTDTPEELRADSGRVARHLSDWMVFADAPEHTRLRTLMTRTFSPRTLAGLAPFVERTADELLERAAEKGTFDLVRDYSLPLPLQVIGRILGVPKELVDDFRGWSEALFAVPQMDGDPAARHRAAITSLAKVEELCGALIAERRRRPTDDLLGHLVAAEVGGERLTDEELIASCTLILIAGHETTAYSLVNAVRALLAHPDQADALRADPALLPAAFEETLRYDSLVGWVGRTATADLEFGGRRIPAGSLVFGMVGAANRDPEVYPDPDAFDVRRRAPRRHVTFGYGMHVCLGAALARMEGVIGLRHLLTRLPDLRAVDTPLRWSEGIAVRGPRSLPVEVGPRGLLPATG